MSVRVSPISRTAAILIIAVGAFLLFTGSVAGVLANEVAGAAFIVLGLVMYMLLLRFTRKLARNVEDVKNQAAGIVAGANQVLLVAGLEESSHSTLGNVGRWIARQEPS